MPAFHRLELELDMELELELELTQAIPNGICCGVIHVAVHLL